MTIYTVELVSGTQLKVDLDEDVWVDILSDTKTVVEGRLEDGRNTLLIVANITYIAGRAPEPALVLDDPLGGRLPGAEAEIERDPA